MTATILRFLTLLFAAAPYSSLANNGNVPHERLLQEVPDNDQCSAATATVLPMLDDYDPTGTTSSVELTINGTTTGASSKFISCRQEEEALVYYQFVAASNNAPFSYRLWVCPNNNDGKTALHVQQDSCDNLGCTGIYSRPSSSMYVPGLLQHDNDYECEGGSMVLWQPDESTTGSTYYVAVGASEGDFTLTLQAFFHPPNNVCGGNVILLEHDTSTVVADTSLATPKVFSCEAEESIGVYYHLLGTGARFQISTCQKETTFNTSLIISDANCEEVGCGEPYDSDLTISTDCEAAPELGKTVEFWSTEGVNYTLVVRGETVDDKGVFGLNITEYERPSNDVCHMPEQLEFDENEKSVTVMGSTANAVRSELGCWPDIYSVAYYSISGTGETFTVSTSNTNFNATILLNDYICDQELNETATGCASCAELECNDTGNVDGTMVQWETQLDHTYVVMVLAEAKEERGEFTLTVQEGKGNFTSMVDSGSSMVTLLSGMAMMGLVTLSLIG